MACCEDQAGADALGFEDGVGGCEWLDRVTAKDRRSAESKDKERNHLLTDRRAMVDEGKLAIPAEPGLENLTHLVDAVLDADALVLWG